MSKLYESIMQGLDEAVEDAKSGNRVLKRTHMEIEPVKNYTASEIKKIRNSTGFSQRAFASYMGVSEKTVEAWEAGKNQPSGAASRVLNMMEIDRDLTRKFPFVKVIK